MSASSAADSGVIVRRPFRMSLITDCGVFMRRANFASDPHTFDAVSIRVFRLFIEQLCVICSTSHNVV